MLKSSNENYNRKIELGIENERLKSHVADLQSQLDSIFVGSAPSIPDQNDTAILLPKSGCGFAKDGAPLVEVVVQQQSVPGYNTGDNVKQVQFMPCLPRDVAFPSNTSSTPAANPATNGIKFGQNDIGATRLFATPCSDLPKEKGSSSTKDGGSSTLVNSFSTPITVKIEPVDDIPLSSSVIIRSDAPEKENSMIQRIHERTLLDARKKKNFGSPISLAFTTNRRLNTDQKHIRQMSVDRECEAYKHTSTQSINLLVSKFKNTIPSDCLLEVQNSYMTNYVTLDAMEVLLNHESLDDSVIDTWGLLVNQLFNSGTKAMDSRVAIARQTYLFRSTLWLYVARFDVDSWFKSMVKQFIDNKIVDALDYDTWLIPINTTGMLDPRKDAGNHWTLLRFSVSTCTWTFYNSISPVNEDMDEHYRCAMTMVNYVEKQIKICGKKMRIPIFRNDHRPRVVYNRNTPQQAGGSVDCGVVVCSVMETVITNGNLLKKSWSRDDGGKYRAKMVDTFCNAILSRDQGHQN